jgi:hypothetical protein
MRRPIEAIDGFWRYWRLLIGDCASGPLRCTLRYSAPFSTFLIGTYIKGDTNETICTPADTALRRGFRTDCNSLSVKGIPVTEGSRIGTGRDCPFCLEAVCSFPRLKHPGDDDGLLSIRSTGNTR